MNSAQPFLGGRSAAMVLTGIIGVSLVGYLVGINDHALRHIDGPVLPLSNLGTTSETSSSAAMPATSYSAMRRRETGPTSHWQPKLERFPADFDFHRCITCHDPHTAEIRAVEVNKLLSLEIRASRRAYNGSPPVIPHAVEHADDAACYACHGEGARVGDRVANRMSHRFLVNCLQCHAAPPPKLLAQFETVTVNTFQGLPAPVAANRAFPSAPPEIPHSTWMRESCLSCHGGDAGWPGLEVTHRWRANCLQCHPSTAPLDSPSLDAANGPFAAFDLQQTPFDSPQP